MMMMIDAERSAEKTDDESQTAEELADCDR